MSRVLLCFAKQIKGLRMCDAMTCYFRQPVAAPDGFIHDGMSDGVVAA